MTVARQIAAVSTLAVAITARAQTAAPRLTANNIPLQHQAAALTYVMPRVTGPLDPLVNFNNASIKFNLQTLMETLRDNRHEGWVLAAYPDPKTSRPLIGAGFSLDLPAREHLQRDPMNPIPFLEPSSAQIWEAAGLPPQQLQAMLEQFDRQLDAWNKKKFRRKIRSGELFPQMTEADADKLLRIYAIQAVHNARAYCRNFDDLTASQQMALAQMVYQMGVNLEQFTNFLGAINTPPAGQAGVAYDAEYWHSVQGTLVQTDWARRYSTRAISVIAMFDPTYASDAYEAERRVSAEVHPLHRAHKKRRAPAVRTASLHKKSTTHGRKKV